LNYQTADRPHTRFTPVNVEDDPLIPSQKQNQPIKAKQEQANLDQEIKAVEIAIDDLSSIKKRPVRDDLPAATTTTNTTGTTTTNTTGANATTSAPAAHHNSSHSSVRKSRRAQNTTEYKQ
jgi:hypothetical protein